MSFDGFLKCTEIIDFDDEGVSSKARELGYGVRATPRSPKVVLSLCVTRYDTLMTIKTTSRLAKPAKYSDTAQGAMQRATC